MIRTSNKQSNQYNMFVTSNKYDNDAMFFEYDINNNNNNSISTIRNLYECIT